LKVAQFDNIVIVVSFGFGIWLACLLPWPVCLR